MHNLVGIESIIFKNEIALLLASSRRRNNYNHGIIKSSPICYDDNYVNAIMIIIKCIFCKCERHVMCAYGDSIFSLSCDDGMV